MIKKRKFIIAILAISGALYALKGSADSSSPLAVYQIHGLEPALTTLVKARLAHSLEALTPPLTANIIQAWNAQHAPVEIQQALAPYGYFKPSIHSKLLYQNKTWQAIYTINPGPLLKITQLKASIQGEGANNAALKRLMDQLPIHQGDSFLSECYEQTKQKLLSTAIAEGYLSAYFSQHRVLINRQSYIANIDLVLDTGPRYYFGPINFEQTILKDSLLRRYVPFKPGDPYSSDRLLKLQDNLNRSGYFQRISINDLTSQKQNQQIPILFKLTPRPSQQYTAGIGYSTDVGIRGTLGWESRYLNQFGHKLSIVSQLSKIQNSLQTTYIIPGKQPNTDNYTINFAIVRKQLPQVDRTTQQIGLGNTHQWKGWQRNLFLNYQIERFNYIDRPSATAHLLTPGITFSRSQFDNPLYALHGYRLNLRVQGADKNLLSSASFLQTQLQTKYILSWNKNSRVILRSDLGYTITPNPTNFPPSLLFYAGGSQSVRGYDYQALGPGRYLMVGSAEYQHKIVNNFYGATFFDMGNAVNNFPINLQKGTGIGIVWISPLGPMQLTLAKALDLPNRPLRLQFSMGVDLL
ncbi:surface antigen D15 [Candidatus Rickettsiella viridis]|uniref:Translocation and assembly module subunit TamA n=1 Tax=Candidatus Rickettsiella viridis TaxID=676208 RepID=A0A2Z5UUS2_9COXI|nr:outer membrane protein assembly factor [Candidatus Rickettsiella viridis]BBB14690.1 surface antigen D15 [Candidatus Rickettsiella viridis]